MWVPTTPTAPTSQLRPLPLTTQKRALVSRDSKGTKKKSSSHSGGRRRKATTSAALLKTKSFGVLVSSVGSRGLSPDQRITCVKRKSVRACVSNKPQSGEVNQDAAASGKIVQEQDGGAAAAGNNNNKRDDDDSNNKIIEAAGSTTNSSSASASASAVESSLNLKTDSIEDRENGPVPGGGGSVEGEGEALGSDLWSFIGSSEDDENISPLASYESIERLKAKGENQTDILPDLPDEMIEELDKCREAKDELEVVRLQLESEAQDLAELAVEANEESNEASAKVSKVIEQVAQISQEEQEAAKDLKAAKKALKKALKKKRKKLEAKRAAEEAENAEESAEQGTVLESIDVLSEGSGDEDSLSTDSLQKQVETLEAAFQSDVLPKEADVPNAIDFDRNWLDGPADRSETSGSVDETLEDSPETRDPWMPETSPELAEIKVLEQNVLDWEARVNSLVEQRLQLEEELKQLQVKSEELVQHAFGCDQRANEAMEDVEQAVAAEMASEARLEEVEKKSEELLNELIKQKKKEGKTDAPSPPKASETAEAPPGEKPEVDNGSVYFTSKDLGVVGDATDSKKKKEDAEKQVSALVNEAEELLEEAEEVATSAGAPEVDETTKVEQAPASKSEEKKEVKVPVAEVAAAEVAAAEKVVVDAEPVTTVSEEVEKEAVEEQPKEQQSTLAIRKLSNLKQAASKRNIFSQPAVRNTLVALVAAATFGIAGRVAFNRGYITKATNIIQTQVIDRIRSPAAEEKKSLKKKSKKLSRKEKAKAKQAALEEAEHEAESGMLDTLWLLATCVVVVPLIAKLPGGSPVLGFLFGGALIGPNALGIINNVNAVKHIAELGVIFLLFNIGLELSFERLQAMQRYVFGLGFSQVVVTMAIAAWLGVSVLGLNGPGATILAAAMSLSSTAVALQVLQDRGEASSRHGRAAFSVLLFQDLAVVVFLMLTPLLAQSQSSQAMGGQEQVKMFLVSIGQAILKACVAIAAIIAGGRVAFRPIYKRIAKTGNAEIFAATTLLVVLGTSMLTQKFGLSMELGAFIAGLLLAETEYALQIESDIAPYKGLLLGLFFMTVGMEFSLALLIQQWKAILATMAILLLGKTAVVAVAGPIFGLSRIASIRAGLMLAPGGEFAFVLLGEAASKAILASAICSQMYLVVAVGMALTPMLATLGNALDDRFETKDVLKLQPSEGEVDDLRGHVIVAGFGRVGQMVCSLMSERLIPFVALDVRSDRVAKGRDMEMPVYFGDSGSAAVLHSIGASKAACAVVVLDTPGANYRCVWAIKKHYPNVKVYVRARDVAHGINLERAGASAVVPETLEPSLQLAAAVLKEMQLPPEDVTAALDDYRRKHIAELSELAYVSGSSLGYGFESEKPKSTKSKSKETAEVEAEV